MGEGAELRSDAAPEFWFAARYHGPASHVERHQEHRLVEIPGELVHEAHEDHACLLPCAVAIMREAGEWFPPDLSLERVQGRGGARRRCIARRVGGTAWRRTRGARPASGDTPRPRRACRGGAP